ncbi:unnamed protein product [Mycena citricolor]|uniref:GP-PDE domain-containing protein n=1 Tax=Mycena citricolor TaxID=2018698 RepID=A0AAD2K5E6_9AGAR|nr:unnamed protein product [Mycena citricolor]
MKKLDPEVITSALIDQATAASVGSRPSPWLAGLRLEDFPGSSRDIQIVHAAHSINSSILSPAAYGDGFTTRKMVEQAHRLGMQVKPWTVNNLEVADDLVRWNVDGIITDYPNVVRRFVQQQGLAVAPKYPKRRVLSCLEAHSH